MEQVEKEFAKRAILENLDYLRERFLKEGEVDFRYPPRILDIHFGLHGPCQNRCNFCYDRRHQPFKSRVRYGPTEIEKFKQELDRIKHWQADSLKVEKVYMAGGGEPTLFPEQSRLVIEKLAPDKDVWLTTNGIRIPKPLFDLLINKGRGVLVSLVGTSSESYKKVASNDGFEDVMNTLAKVLKARQQTDSSLRVNTTHVFNQESLPDLKGLILRLNEMGVDEFRCRYDIFSDPNSDLNKEGKEILLETAQSYPGMRMRVMLKSPPNEILPEQYRCFAPFIWPTWNPLNGVFPCAHVATEKSRIESKKTNGVFSLIDIEDDPQKAMTQTCHRRCPSRIHWFNLFLNGHDLQIPGIPQSEAIQHQLLIPARLFLEVNR